MQAHAAGSESGHDSSWSNMDESSTGAGNGAATGEMTVEGFLMQECERQVSALMEEANNRIEAFRAEAATVRAQLAASNGLRGGAGLNSASASPWTLR